MRKSVLLLLLCFIWTCVGCQSRETAHFGIYLLAQDVPTAQLALTDIQQLTLQEQPVVSEDDIIVYHTATHKIELTPEAYARLEQLFATPIKTSGLPFVVCVGKDRIYTGAFWVMWSSLSYDGIVIEYPFFEEGNTIQIALGYPAPAAFTGQDPRTDARIIKALEAAGKAQ